MSFIVHHFISSIDLASGGPARSMPSICIGVKEIGVLCEVHSHISPNPNVKKLIDSGIPVSLVAPGHLFSQTIIEGVSFKNSVVHIQDIWNPSLHWVAKSCRENNTPYIISPRGMLEPWSLQQKKWKKKLAFALYQKADLQKASCIHATALSEMKSVRDLGIKSPIAVIPNGIKVDDYTERDYSLKTSGKRRLLFLSRIHPKKGIDILLESWANIPTYLRDKWELVIAGEGDNSYSLDDLQRMTSERFADLGVIIAGPQYGVAKTNMYKSADLFVLPTHSENFGMVIAEAMCCGVPVITTTGTPWKELKEHDLGWYIDLTVENLTNAMQDAILRSDSERFEKGKKSREWILANYSIEAVAHKYKRLYEWLVGEGVRPDFVYLK